jgi:hypothetical protein
MARCRWRTTLYVIRAGARTLNLDTPIASVVEQEIQVAEIPLFAYMGYSEFDLTFVTIPGNNITLTAGFTATVKVYCDPSGILEFMDNVTAADEIRAEQHPADATDRQAGSVTFSGRWIARPTRCGWRRGLTISTTY